MARRSEMTFQEKYKDRMENMGKDGITGIIRISDIPLQKGINGIGIQGDGDIEMWNQMSKNCKSLDNLSWCQ
jgi:hypothetical protein